MFTLHANISKQCSLPLSLKNKVKRDTYSLPSEKSLPFMKFEVSTYLCMITVDGNEFTYTTDVALYMCRG